MSTLCYKHYCSCPLKQRAILRSTTSMAVFSCRASSKYSGQSVAPTTTTVVNPKDRTPKTVVEVVYLYFFSSVNTVRHKAMPLSVKHAVVEPYPAPPPELSQECPKSVRRLSRVGSSFSAARAGCVTEAGRSGRRRLNSMLAVCHVLSVLYKLLLTEL